MFIISKNWLTECVQACWPPWIWGPVSWPCSPAQRRTRTPGPGPLMLSTWRASCCGGGEGQAPVRWSSTETPGHHRMKEGYHTDTGQCLWDKGTQEKHENTIVWEHDDVTLINIHDITCQPISRGGIPWLYSGRLVIDLMKKMLNS